MQADKSQIKLKPSWPFLLGVQLLSNRQLPKATSRLFQSVFWGWIFLLPFSFFFLRNLEKESFFRFVTYMITHHPHQYHQSAKLLYFSLLALAGRRELYFTLVGLNHRTVKWKINLKCYQISQILAHALLTGDSSGSAAGLRLTLYFLPLQFLGFKKQISLDIPLVLSVTCFIPDFSLLEEWLMELVVSLM